jgi:hypothetical protein
MKRKAAASLSVLLLLGVALLWARGRVATDTLTYTTVRLASPNAAGAVEATNYLRLDRSGVWLMRIARTFGSASALPNPEASSNWAAQIGEPPSSRVERLPSGVDISRPLGAILISGTSDTQVIDRGSEPQNRSYVKMRVRTDSLLLPFWLLVAAASVGAVPLVLRFLVAMGRQRRGHCVQCGYDLRGTPDRCPECGHEHANSSAVGSRS